jgi:hypothetical protein
MTPRRDRTRVDADGVRTTRSGGVRTGVWVAAVLAIAVAGTLLIGSRAPLGDKSEKTTREQEEIARGLAARIVREQSADPKTVERLRRRDTAAPQLPEHFSEGSTAAADAVADTNARQHDEVASDTTQPEGDEPTGIALFPPPGTDPLKRGIIVPEDFEVPPGFLRHYQVTDDGKPLPAILMFHPDYQPIDEHGEPIPIPEDRVVPPEMAPPGLAIEMMDPPDTAVPMLEVPEGGSLPEPEP